MASHGGSVLWSLAKLSLILGYFYVCDRTNYLLKENKYFTQVWSLSSFKAEF